MTALNLIFRLNSSNYLLWDDVLVEERATSPSYGRYYKRLSVLSLSLSLSLPPLTPAAAVQSVVNCNCLAAAQASGTHRYHIRGKISIT